MLNLGGNIDFSRKPRAFCCYICGREYGTNSFQIHLPQCKAIWIKRENLKPKNERRPLPPPPRSLHSTSMTSADMTQYNNEAFQNYNDVALVPCQHCGRTFEPDRLKVHNRSCTANNPARRLGTARVSSNANATPQSLPSLTKHNSESPQKSIYHTLSREKDNQKYASTTTALSTTVSPPRGPRDRRVVSFASPVTTVATVPHEIVDAWGGNRGINDGALADTRSLSSLATSQICPPTRPPATASFSCSVFSPRPQASARTMRIQAAQATSGAALRATSASCAATCASTAPPSGARAGGAAATTATTATVAGRQELSALDAVDNAGDDHACTPSNTPCTMTARASCATATATATSTADLYQSMFGFSEALEGTDSLELVPCAKCNRTFATSRLPKHQAVCLGPSRLGARAKATDRGPASSPSPSRSMPPRLTHWREKHAEFQATITYARRMDAVLKRGGNIVRELPPPPPATNASYVLCGSCGRRYSETAAARHIPLCANIVHKPKPPPFARGSSATARASPPALLPSRARSQRSQPPSSTAAAAASAQSLPVRTQVPTVRIAALSSLPTSSSSHAPHARGHSPRIRGNPAVAAPQRVGTLRAQCVGQFAHEHSFPSPSRGLARARTAQVTQPTRMPERIPTSGRFCVNCGTPRLSSGQFCHECGYHHH